MRCNHSIIACLCHICVVLFLVHILFVVNRTFNATSAKRLQQHPLLFTTNHTDRTFFLWRLHTARPPHPDHSTIFLWSEKPEQHVRRASHWQQATMEIMHRNHSVIACSRHIYVVLFFAHIPFMVNCTFSAMPTEWLQHDNLFCCFLILFRQCLVRLFHFVTLLNVDWVFHSNVHHGLQSPLNWLSDLTGKPYREIKCWLPYVWHVSTCWHDYAFNIFVSIFSLIPSAPVYKYIVHWNLTLSCCFCATLQPYNSPVDCARELLKPSKDSSKSSSLQWKRNFLIWVSFFCEWRHQWSRFRV